MTERDLTMHFTLKVWRQKSAERTGEARAVRRARMSVPTCRSSRCSTSSTSASMERGEEPIAFAHDCREGICGTCSLMINGVAHGPVRGAATCQVHMRSFTDGQTIHIEPWRARAFPIIKDLIVDREALDRIVQAGGFISAPTGQRAGRERDPDREAGRRRRDGRGRLHRVRRVRCRVSQRVRVAVYRREGQPPRAAAAGTTGALPTRRPHGRADGSGRALADARSSANARTHARSSSASTRSLG